MWPFQRTRPSIERTDAWYVQLDGEPVALIDDPQDDDMFWFTWRISALEGKEIPADLWDYANDDRRTFRHAETGEVTGAIPAGPNAAYSEGRVLIRGPHKTGPGRIQRVF